MFGKEVSAMELMPWGLGRFQNVDPCTCCCSCTCSESQLVGLGRLTGNLNNMGAELTPTDP